MNESQPIVSIIVPVYNVENYLRECLDSICAQTLREIEIICVDDGATDSSGTILDEYALKDVRIRVIHKQNGGLSSARNAGLKQMTGRYLLFVDSDDFISSSLCEHAVQKAEETEADMILFHHALYERGKITMLNYENNSLLGTSPLGNIKAFFEYGPNVWKTLWKSELINKEGILFHEGLLWEDVSFTAYYAFRASNVSLLPEIGYFYRQNPESIMHQRNSPTASLYSVQAFNLAWEQIKSFNPPADVKRFLFTEKLRLIYYGYTHTALDFLRAYRRNIRLGVLPGELEMLRAGELDLLPLIRFFFLSIYGNWKERINGKYHLIKYQIIRFAERVFRIHIYPS